MAAVTLPSLFCRAALMRTGVVALISLSRSFASLHQCRRIRHNTQAGHGHVNNQPNEYIIKTLDGLGYDFNETVAKIGRNASVLPWFQNTFMVFNRRTAAANTTHCALKV